MPKDERDTLELLKAELNFLKKGGYGRSPREPWRAQLIFEDSPSCMNYDTKDHPAPCAECALMQFVPAEKQAEKVPCRHIPLTAEGETLQELYRGGTQQELEDALGDWLSARIALLESRQASNAAEKNGMKRRSRRQRSINLRRFQSVSNGGASCFRICIQNAQTPPAQRRLTGWQEGSFFDFDEILLHHRLPTRTKHCKRGPITSSISGCANTVRASTRSPTNPAREF